MERRFPEADWKHWREVSKAALDRFCADTLEDAVEIARGEGTPHARYLGLFDLLRERDRQIGRAFDDRRRSTAYHQLAAAVDLGLVTPEELAGFSDETRGLVAVLLGEK